MRKTTLLRHLLAQEEILVVPGAFDVLTARVIEHVGFNAVYLSGYGAAASTLGQPDAGLLTLTEMVNLAFRVVSAVDIPVIADADTGYGTALNVVRAVKEYERAGVACIQLEDQKEPKKCGHVLGRQVIAREEMVAKVKAAVDAREDPDFMIIACTHARTHLGLEEAIERGQEYAEAGADIVFIESPESVDELRTIPPALKVPALASMVERGRTPLLTVSELGDMGYKIALFPVASILSVAKTVERLMVILKQEGSTMKALQEMWDLEEFNNFIGLPRIRVLESRYKG